MWLAPGLQLESQICRSVEAFMHPRRLYNRISSGHLRNVSFSDMLRLVRSFGFNQLRVRGSHHIFSHPVIPELLNLQDWAGQAKPYQIRQFLRLVNKHGLRMIDLS